MKKLQEVEKINCFIKAEYKEQEVEEYKGNPLIEALPPINSLLEAYEKMKVNPIFYEYETILSEEIRYHMLFRLQKFFHPITQHLDLEKRLSRLIRSGYIHRNPLNINEVRFLRGETNTISSTASSFTLMGFSGIGKTSAVERILSLYPQVILHESPVNRLQVVWLKLNCPHDGSLKTLCLDFFLKLDELLGTSYFIKYGDSRNSISSLVIHMGRLSRIHCIGALIIDEIQHLLTTRDKGSEKMMNFFVTLINEIGIPVMLIGTMKAKKVLQQDFRQARRGSGHGDMVWEQMKFDDDWDMFIEGMWEYQWTSNKTTLTEELKRTIYEESQGIVDIAIKLFSLAQSRAIETGNEVITSAAIRQVSREDLKLVQPMLNALKDGLKSEIIQYEDITPVDLAGYLELRKSKVDLRATIQKQKELQQKQKEEFQISNIEKAIHALVTLGVEVAKAEKAVITVSKRNKNIDNSTKLMTMALTYLDELDEKKILSKTNKKSDNKLIDLITKGKKIKKSSYDTLLVDGYIKKPVNDLIL